MDRIEYQPQQSILLGETGHIQADDTLFHPAATVCSYAINHKTVIIMQRSANVI